MKPSVVMQEFLHLFFPDCCAVCEAKLLPSEEGVCLKCIYKLPKTHNFNDPGNAAEELLAGRFPFERVATFCVYAKGGTLQPIVHEIKYNHKQQLGITMGRLFGQDLIGSDFIRPVNLIVPVPLHPKKQRKRGYNQAEMIAKGLSQATSIPVSTGNLVRAIYNPTQTKRSKTQRWENVKDIFSVRNTGEFSDKHLLLVDDVITTGSTLEACADALQHVPGLKLSIATLGEVF